MTRCVSLSLLLVGLFAGSASAQVRTVTGTVTSAADGQPLPGVNVALQGTMAGTTTDTEGRYTLEVPGPEAVLAFSFVGFETVEVEVGERRTIDVALEDLPELMDDVVVIGYGEETRERLAASTSSVSAADLANVPVAGVDAAIQGRAAGVQVFPNSGTPGAGISVRVRGASSASGSNQPLYVIDGVPMLSEDFSQLGYGGQDITAVTNIPPADIESVDILKDAAATAIYGSRGANGVVLITTKRGRSSRPTITYETYAGSQRLIRPLDLLNAREYVEYMNTAALTDDSTDAFAYGNPDSLTADTDWQAAAFQGAPIQNHSLAIAGGDARARYYVSGTYFDQGGIVLGSGYDRASARVNLDLLASERLTFETSVAFSRESSDRIEGDDTIRGTLPNAIGNQPTVPIYREDGTFTGIDDGLTYANGIAIGELNTGSTLSHRALANLRTAYRLGPGLYLNARGGADVLSVRESRYRSPLVQGDYAETAGGIAISAFDLSTRLVGEGFAQLDRTLGRRHDLGLTAGASFELNRIEQNYIRGEGLGEADFRHISSATTIESYDGLPSEYNLVSFFSRGTYILDDRYIFSGSVRADGSTRFGEDKRFGVFPAGAFAWRLGQEPFVRRAVGGWLTDLKLRTSYGLSGSDDIGNYSGRDAWEADGYGGEPGLVPTSLENAELTWEATRQFDVGLDLTLFDERVGLIADYYRKYTTDFLFDLPITYTSGFSILTSNVGEIENKGFEVFLRTLNARPSAPGGFRWETTLNLSRNLNEVKRLNGIPPYNEGQDGIARVEEGAPLGAFHAYHFVGVDPQHGYALYENVDGGGTCVSALTAEANAFEALGLTACVEADKRIVGSPYPDVQGGLTNTLSFRGFDLHAFLLFAVGNEVANLLRTYAADGGLSDDNKLRDVLDYWQQPGDATDEPRPSAGGITGGGETSDRFLEDGSFLRVKTLTLGYTLPGRFVEGFGGRSLRLYVSAQNLLTFTRYSGMDPEANYAGTDNIVLSTDFYTFPQPRTFLAGLTLGL